MKISRLLLAVIALVIASCESRQEQSVTAWRCSAKKDWMAIRIGSESGPYESIGFDGGGVAIHLGGEKYALNREDIQISRSSALALRIESKTRVLIVTPIESTCLDWLILNQYVR